MSTAATPNVAAWPAPADGDRELKFVFPNARLDHARRWLGALCRRDAAFPEALVWTLYSDTPALQLLGEKINSEYLKRKVRLRWYSDLDGNPSGPAFMEAKMRTGNRRSKVRVRLAHPADELARWPVQDARFRTFPALLRPHGVLDAENWQPIVQLKYRRDRFVEPASRARVSLDGDIAATEVNPAICSVADPSPLRVAVLEVKGGVDELPLALRPMLQLGARKTSFSKFMAVYLHMTRRVF